MLISGKASNLCSCHCLSSTTACNYSTNVYILLFEAFSLKALAFDIFAISKKQKSFSRLLVKLYSSLKQFFSCFWEMRAASKSAFSFAFIKSSKSCTGMMVYKKYYWPIITWQIAYQKEFSSFPFPLVSISALSNFSPYFIAQILTKYSWYLHSPRRIWRTHTKGRFHHLVEKENHYREVGDLPNC